MLVANELGRRSAEIGEDCVHAIQAGAGHDADIELGLRARHSTTEKLICAGEIQAAQHFQMCGERLGRGEEIIFELRGNRE